MPEQEEDFQTSEKSALPQFSVGEELSVFPEIELKSFDVSPVDVFNSLLPGSTDA